MYMLLYSKDVNIEKNTHFQRVVELEYATKYLESLGVEPT